MWGTSKFWIGGFCAFYLITGLQVGYILQMRAMSVGRNDFHAGKIYATVALWPFALGALGVVLRKEAYPDEN